eukprot:7379741-Prymnesium_polylepis.1
MAVFELHLPLLTALLHPGMRERHWAEVNTATGIAFRPSLELTLSKLLASHNLQPHLPKIQAIVGIAAKEAA